jgi:chromosome segregation ATPase
VRLFRRHPAPVRVPHPDARVEVVLQQIISLRAAAARNEAALDQHHKAITRISGEIARNSGSNWNSVRRESIAGANAEITRLNMETAELHAQISELTAKLSDDDLLWLNARRLGA